jgi:hypothetical protein
VEAVGAVIFVALFLAADLGAIYWISKRTIAVLVAGIAAAIGVL